MNKSIIILVVLIIIGGIFLLNRKESQAPVTTASPSQEGQALTSPNQTISPNPSQSAGKVFTITRLGDKLNPQDLTVKVGDSVTFTNNDNTPWWPVSGVHPTHQICPGFDALRGLTKGMSYSHTFTVAKTCPFHNHLDAGNKNLLGKIVVIE